MLKIVLELDSPFLYIVLDIKTEIPLLIGKLSNPKSFCKIPHVVNGFVIDHLFAEKLLAKDLVDVETKIKVLCNPGYEVQNFERNTFKTCKSQGWDSEFPKCKKMCRVVDLKSHSTHISCYNNAAQIDCQQLIAPGITVQIECNPRYSFLPHAQKMFECLESGEWSGQRTECKADCGQLVANASLLLNKGGGVNPHEIPWNAVIYHKDEQICGGTIISELIVLSAAHCFRTDLAEGVSGIVKSEYKIAVGKYYCDIDASEADETQTLKIVEVTIPANYNGIHSKYLGDIAVLTLDAAIIYRNHIAPACLNINARGVREKQLPIINTKGLLAGFEVTQGLKQSKVLRKIDVKIVSDERCLRMVTYDNNSFLVYDKSCAGINTHSDGPCKGDTGNGLSFQDVTTKDYHVFGIVTNTTHENECFFAFYVFYTNVMDYIDLIKEKHTTSLSMLRKLIEQPDAL